MTDDASTIAGAESRDALVSRLAVELGDEGLAATLVGSFDDDFVRQVENELGDETDPSSPLLSFTPSTVPSDQVDSLVVFAFGIRIADDNTVLPGPINEELADVAQRFVADRPVPVFAQWEVAAILRARGVPGIISIDPDIADDGDVTYLSTEGVAEAAVRLANKAAIEPGHVGVIAFADHAVRSVANARKAGLTADVPDGTELPSTYDPESDQPWTRDRLTYVATDLLARLFTFP